ncbi:hypothetical protein HOD29_00785 [archaeon]|nr:hypothetical protein [archaeon]
MKEKKKDLTKPQRINVNQLEQTLYSIKDNFNEVEITGGGDPLIHLQINEIVNLFRDKYTKLYTNGFLLKPISNLDELNISRVHWNSKINNQFYKSNFHNDLEKVLDFYHPLVDKIRIQTILLKGAIDSKEKLEEFVSKYENKVDEFMFRTLFKSCSLEQDKSISYFDFKHPKVTFDKTLDNYNRKLYFIGTDCIIHNKFQY